VSQILEALEQAGWHFPDRMLERCLHVLKHRGPRALLRMADRLGSDLIHRKGIGEHLDYLRKREALMQYPAFRAQGWPLGSGMVESANKLVVQARLKGSGMHWQRKNVNPLLTLRMAVCNDRWPQMWGQASCQQRTGQLRHQHVLGGAEVPISLTRASSSPQARSHAPAAASRPRALPPLSPLRSEAAPPLLPLASQQPDHCPCGTPLIRFKGHRTKEFCSGRCRQRAFRQRQAMKHWKP
jgi:hypothetical protein